MCGSVEGSYFGSVNGFTGAGRPTTLNGNYVDGISLTYGNESVKKHIWTFSATTGMCSAMLPIYVGANHSCLQSFKSNESHLSTFEREF